LFARAIAIFGVAPTTEPDDFPAAGMAFTKSYEARGKAYAKFLDAYTRPLCCDEVAKFMYKYAYAKDGYGGE